MDGISNFRDKYLKEYRVKNLNTASHTYPDTKHLYLTLKANLTKEKQPHVQHEYSVHLTQFVIPTPLANLW